VFTCPKCGSHEFKTCKPLRDGTIERECLGVWQEKMLAPKNAGKEALFEDGTPMAEANRFMHPHRCCFIWDSKDDGSVGIEASDLVKPA
jgi:hypothetical protein